MTGQAWAGPAFRDVARRYDPTLNLLDVVKRALAQGSRGRWPGVGAARMPPQPQAAGRIADIQRIARRLEGLAGRSD